MAYDTELKELTKRIGTAKALVVVPRELEKQNSGAAEGQESAQHGGTQTAPNKPTTVNITIESMQRIVDALAKITKDCDSTLGSSNRAVLLAKDLDERVDALLSQSRSRDRSLEDMKLAQDNFIASISKLINGAYPATVTTPHPESNGDSKGNDLGDAAKEVTKQEEVKEDANKEEVKEAKQNGVPQEGDKTKITTLGDVITQLQTLLEYLASTRSQFLADILKIIRTAQGDSTTQTEPTEAIVTQELVKLVKPLQHLQTEISEARAALKNADRTIDDNKSLSDGIATLGQAINTLSGQLDEARTALADADKTLNADISLPAGIKTLGEKLSQRSKEIITLEATVRSLTDENRKLNDENGTLRGNIESLKASESQPAQTMWYTRVRRGESAKAAAEAFQILDFDEVRKRNSHIKEAEWTKGGLDLTFSFPASGVRPYRHLNSRVLGDINTAGKIADHFGVQPGDILDPVTGKNPNPTAQLNDTVIGIPAANTRPKR